MILERYFYKKNLSKCEERYRVLYKKYEAVTGNNHFVESLNHELTKQVQAEKHYQSQKDHILIQQSRFAAMGEIIASIGFQWRQPLNRLSLLIQDVSEAQEFNEINDQYINRFTKESMALIKHMARSINDFRKFYQPNKEKTAFSLSEAIEDALSIFSLSLKNHDIHVYFEYRGQHKVIGYRNEFIQVVLNILMNARDAFIACNRENRNISIKIDEDDCFYMTEISDNGGGMEPTLLDKIFDPYFTTRPNGTGLGLYMTKMIIENMNGNVKAENIETGARFCLFVPKAGATEVLETA
jgi:signal transduction histidine kinase